MKEKILIKAKLKQDVTESEFLMATFHDENFDRNIYDIDKMKTTTLTGKLEEDGGLFIDCIPYRHSSHIIGYGYENEDTSIWEYEIKNEKLKEEYEKENPSITYTEWLESKVNELRKWIDNDVEEWLSEGYVATNPNI